MTEPPDEPPNAAERAGSLLSEPESSVETDKYAREVQQALEHVRDEALASHKSAADDQMHSLYGVTELVQKFHPVPWFIWRLSNFVFSGGAKATVPEGLVLGLRRLLFAAASDRVLGSGEKVNSMQQALEVLSPDVTAALAVIHAVCKRLQTKPFERIWRPILDDALLRSHIGYYVGMSCDDFGAGRGMLAGFAGRAGLAILISSGAMEQAGAALTALAEGGSIAEVGETFYGCDPLQVSAMLLSACGCGRDAALGAIAYSRPIESRIMQSDAQQRWLAAFSIIEATRTGAMSAVSDSLWETLLISSIEDRKHLRTLAQDAIKEGHGWDWLL